MLLEAAIVSVLGGTIGVVVGVSMAGIVSGWNDWPLLITPGTVAGAFFLSLCVGLFFGYYPARRAARLNPIEALRAD
jgi:ABC-type antimicrobial peptide transport system permease subunit